jgi:uncharacterized protein YutE (UPF0331/DUF86 family)
MGGSEMIDREVVRKKLQELNSYLKEMEKLKAISWDEFFSSLSKQWMVFHGLQLSIQIVIDVGNHILASLGETQIEDYVDIIDKLGERRIIPLEFAREIRGMAGLRNILVHEYVKIDLRKIYDILQNRLTDFYNFIEYINQFLKSKES